MRNYSRLLLVPYLLTVSFYFIEGFWPEYEMLPYIALAMESILAMTIGYTVILLDVHASLKQCAMLAAMIGVIRFLMGLPLALTQWDSASDNLMSIVGYFLASAILTGCYSFFGLFGGNARRIVFKLRNL